MNKEGSVVVKEEQGAVSHEASFLVEDEQFTRNISEKARELKQRLTEITRLKETLPVEQFQQEEVFLETMSFVRDLIGAPPPLPRENEPAEAYKKRCEPWSHLGILACIGAIDALNSHASKKHQNPFVPAPDTKILDGFEYEFFVHVMERGLDDDVEFTGRAVASMQEEVSLRTARELLSMLPPELPADSLDELFAGEPGAQTKFFRGYVQAGKLKGEFGILRNTFPPLRVLLEEKLYCEDSQCFQQAFLDTEKMKDVETVQTQIVEEVLQAGRVSLFEHIRLRNGLFRGAEKLFFKHKQWGFAVAHNGLFQEENFLQEAISTPEGMADVMRNIKSSSIDDVSTMQRICDAGFAEQLLNTIDHLQKGSEIVIEALMSSASGRTCLMENIYKLNPSFTPEQVQIFLVEHPNTVWRQPKKFHLDRTFLQKQLFDTAEGRKVVAEDLVYGSAFTLEETKILLTDGFATQVAASPEVFLGTISEHAFGEMLAATSEGRAALMRYIRQQKGLSKEVANTLIQEGSALQALASPESFTYDAQQLLIEKATETKEGSALLAAKLNVYYGLTNNIAEKLMEEGFLAQVARNIRAFPMLEQEKKNSIIKQLLRSPEGPDIFSTIETSSFTDLTLEDAQLILQNKSIETCLTSCTSFSPEVRLFLIEQTLLQPNATELFVKYLHWFRDLPAVIAEKLMEAGHTEAVIKNRRSFKDIDPLVEARLDVYERIAAKIAESPSRTVRRMAETLKRELFSSDDPEEAYTKIERLYLRNHIPLVGKLFLTFDTIYNEEHLQRDVYSPSLKKASPREAKMLIYKDLLNIHLDTGNPSFKAYLEDLQAVEPLLEKVEAEDELNASETSKLESFFRSAEVLQSESTHGKGREVPRQETSTLREQLTLWKKSLGVREGQKTHDRLEEMFLRPAGVASIEEALSRMDASKKRADTLNRELVTSSPEKILLQEGDLLKGVDSKYFLSYLQNGNVAGEFLGYASKHDYTRMDTDTGKVLAKDLEQGNSGALEMNPAKSYGDMVLVMRPTKERFFTDTPPVHDQIRGKTAPYEVFSSPVADHERHFGIRTGAPFTEVRAIILKNPERRMMLDLKMDLVANGYYVPITDIDGKVLFTPEEFDELQARAFSGTEMVKEPFTLEKTTRSEEELHKIEALQAGIVAEREMIDTTRKTIEMRIKEALAQAGIALRTSGELAVGAEILNTGSTARHTSIVGETVDFDMAIRLDETDLRQKAKIMEALNALLQGETEGGATAQWRRKGVNIDGTMADIDITFTSKPEVEGTPSHVAIEQRLASLDQNNQAEGDLVRANIVYAKKILKASSVYKKLDGGLGGLGVENWILQNGGSFAKARETFLEAAIDEEGNVRPFDECAARYNVPDAGVNLIENLDGDANGRINHRHDNFFYFLNKEGTNGYTKMVEALRLTPS